MPEDDVTVRPAQPGEAEAFLESQIERKALVWHAVGSTWQDWFDKIGGWPTEQGTYIRTDKGVFLCGMCGLIYVGEKRDDGTIVGGQGSIDLNLGNAFSRHVDIVHEYADDPNCGYERNERGAIIPSDDGDDW